jgi:hypothetical protein
MNSSFLRYFALWSAASRGTMCLGRVGHQGPTFSALSTIAVAGLVDAGVRSAGQNMEVSMLDALRRAGVVFILNFMGIGVGGIGVGGIDVGGSCLAGPVPLQNRADDGRAGAKTTASAGFATDLPAELPAAADGQSDSINSRRFGSVRPPAIDPDPAAGQIVIPLPSPFEIGAVGLGLIGMGLASGRLRLILRDV